MNAKTGIAHPGLDNAKLAASVLLVLIGIAAFYYFAAYSALLRVIGLLIIGATAVFIAYQTAIGKKVWQFFVDSRMEVRKVIWPTQDETMQTTLVVFVMVLVMSIILWLFDALLVTIVRALTGQGS